MNKEYQVLARKYRPRNFAELISQEHVVKTLTNALDSNNLHHGFIFTGTRGVGKTTIARIFAKSINCEKGVSSKPCGECETCLEIDRGQSIDLIELDAASHTGVDNMRDILDNAQYLPTKNRYKVYLIDEVHMLSKSSFNALLKTLEEPPKHIKFLLATTDYKKLPITILSRCLQFSLQKINNGDILKQLIYIMRAEKLKYEEPALAKIAELGNGSMRDALSLLDQTISYSNGDLKLQEIQDMLGLVGQQDIIAFAECIFNQEGQKVIDLVDKLENNGDNLTNVLKDISSLFHQISIAQVVNDSTQQLDVKIQNLANQVSNKDLQIFYQMAINGLRDLSYAPNDKTGVEMTLLRMLAFHSKNNKTAEKKTIKNPTSVKNNSNIEKIAVKVDVEQYKNTTSTVKTSGSIDIANQQQWEKIANTLNFSSSAIIIIKNSIFESFNNNVFILNLDEYFAPMLSKHTQDSLTKTLQGKFGDITIKIKVSKLTQQTIAAQEKQVTLEQKQQIQKKFLTNQEVIKLQQMFGAKVDANTIRKIKEDGNV